MFPKSSSCLYVLYFWLIISIILSSSSTAGGGAKNVNSNITKLLERYPNLSSFNAYLSTTHLADSINNNNGNITLLAMDDAVMCHLLNSIKLNETLIKRVLSMHVVLGYYDVKGLQRLPDNTALLTFGNTIHQEHGNSTEGMTIMVTKLNNKHDGKVTFAIAVGPSGPETGVVTAKLAKAIASVPRYISVLQISHLQVPHGKESYPTLFTSARSGSKQSKALPIDTIFKLPSPLPAWPADKRFARGSIDLGGLVVQQISTFTKVWEIYEKGPDNLGATFFEPSVLPKGYFMLGSYAQPNNRPLYGWVLVGKDTTNDLTNGSLKSPIDYILIWSGESSNINANGVGYIWQPVPPLGYKAVGHVATTCSQKPSLDKVRCVRSDLTEHCEADTSIWKIDKGSDRISIFNLRPVKRGIKAHGVSVGSFIATTTSGKNLSALACLKNAMNNMSSSMPSKSQIDALVQLYAPRVYFHPDETFLPSSVSWFLTNGALLYKNGEESKPLAIEPTGSNLPRGGSDDDAYWLDLPVNSASKERVKKGYLQSSQAYIHVKPIFGATFTDIVIWLFYPFNGPTKVKVMFFNLTLGKLGAHVGDWEHVTLRISNFNGQLQSVYFSQHSAGVWVSASMLQYIDGNRFVAYASLHGHAANYKPGSFLQGKLGIGVRNDFGRSNMFMDTGANFTVIAAEYLGSAITAPPWLYYPRKWGPSVDSDIAMELVLVGKILPGKLKKVFQNAMCIPDEALKEEGPTGPIVKSSWNGDEIED